MSIRGIYGIIVSVLCLFFWGTDWAYAQTTVNSNTFGAIEARHIGPAVMSGRIAALDAVDRDPRIIYVGAASGGVWKTENQGTTFEPVFDDHIQSIGAIRIDQNHPDTIWVGTGETWVRNSVSIGNGIYKTTNGGDSWTHMGLEGTERIARIVVHPEHPDTVWVAATGPLWSAGADRGVYKTTDGGQSWEKVLYVDENTGASDIAIDKHNPDILYAGMWDFRRKPWTFRSGGSGSGLYKTTDGGKYWSRLENGLPDSTLGRIAITVSPVIPNRVYALVESENTAIYRSDDYGNSWKETNSTQVAEERPFYFANIYADPVDTNRVYKPSFNLNVSSDSGKTFSPPYAGGGNVHVDHHAFYVAPNDNNILYLGTDGGLYISEDKGATWRFARNLPISQFYHVSADNADPYNVYGGLQDNGSWTGPSESPAGITNSDWKRVGGGDGFNVFADKLDSNIIYWQWQGGNIYKYFRNTGEAKEIRPYRDKNMEELRFNWNTPIAFSDDGQRMYVGSQYLFRSSNKGNSWERISPDLTTDDPERQGQEESGGLTIDNSTAENNTTIFAISESPLDRNVIWAGTDDGNLQVTRNGGKKWTNVVNNIPGLPKGNWVSSIEASRFDKATAYVTFDNHRQGDMSPYVFKTTDYGKSWETLSDSTIESYTHIILEDTVNPDLLFLGTEFGMFVSIDGGEVWSRFTGNFPKVSVRDMELQERENDLVVATHGRGIFIIDDISPLRKITAEVLNSEVAFLESKPYEINALGTGQSANGDDEFTGRNPEQSAEITYYLQKRHVFGDMYLELYDPKGNKIKELPAGKRRGINRVPWAIRKKPPKVPSSQTLSGNAIFGPTYPPGTYTVKLIKNDETYEGKVTIQWDPNSPHSEADRQIQLETVNKAYTMLEELGYLDARATDLRDQARAAVDSTEGDLSEELDALATELEEMHKTLVATRTGGITGEEQLREKIARIYGAVINYGGRPTDSQISGLNTLEQLMKEKQQQFQHMVADRLASINRRLLEAGQEELSILSRDEFFEEE